MKRLWPMDALRKEPQTREEMLEVVGEIQEVLGEA